MSTISMKTPATSQPLTNSQRRLYKASYRPLTIPAGEQPPTGRVLEKLAFLRGLAIQAQEFAQLERGEAAQAQSQLLGDERGKGSPPRVMESMKRLTADLSFATMRRYGPLLASVSPEELIAVGNALAEMRSAVATDVRNKLHELQDRFAETSRSAVSGVAPNIPSTVLEPMIAAVKWAMDECLPVYDELQSIAARLLSAPDISAMQSGAGICQW